MTTLTDLRTLPALLAPVRRLSALLALVLGLFSASALAAEPVPTVQLHHFVLDPGPDGSLRVEEKIVLDNPGAPLPPGSVRFHLAEGAQNVLLPGKEAGELEIRDGEVVVKGTVPAGQTSYGFEYVLPPGAPHFVLVQKSRYLTRGTYVLVPPSGLEVRGENVEDRGVVDWGGQNMRVYAAGPVPPGGETLFAVTRGTGTGGGAGKTRARGYLSRNQPVSFHNPGHIRLWYQSPFRGLDAHLFLAIVFGAPLAAAGIHFARRWKKTAVVPATGQTADEQLFQRLRIRERILLAKLVELERKHGAERLAEEEYARLREAYRRKLVQVKLQLREFAG